jgi:translation elongation factor EF-Tu-like GTPase
VTRFAGFVTVVGDATASTVREQLGKSGIRTSSTLDDQADSSLIIVVQDSTVGPMPVHLEIAKVLGERSGSEYLWIFTSTAMVDDQELLELEELECREIFNGVGLPGDDVPFAFDSTDAPVASEYECPKGWNAIVGHIRSVVE